MVTSDRAFGDEMPEILLVEDNSLHIRLVKSMLADVWPEPNALRTARRLDRAIEKLEEEAPELILLDLVLPDADGLEAVNALLAIVPHIPIVVLSSHDDDALALQAVREGAQDYLVKGTIGPAELARAIRFAIHRHRGGAGLVGGPPLGVVGLTGAAVIDGSGSFTLVHGDIAAMLGVATVDLVGASVVDFAHPNDIAAWTEAMAGVTEDGQPEFSIRVRHVSGNDLRVRVDLAPLAGEGDARFLMRWYPLAPEGTVSSGQYAVVTEWA